MISINCRTQQANVNNKKKKGGVHRILKEYKIDDRRFSVGHLCLRSQNLLRSPTANDGNCKFSATRRQRQRVQ